MGEREEGIEMLRMIWRSPVSGELVDLAPRLWMTMVSPCWEPFGMLRVRVELSMCCVEKLLLPRRAVVRGIWRR